MLLKQCVVIYFILYLKISNNTTETCSCKTYTHKPYSKRVKYLVKLPNSKKINQLSLIGSHASLSFNINNKELQTQDLDIPHQLKYGIRVLDIGLRAQSNILISYVDKTMTSYQLVDALVDTNEFLTDNPGEFIIMIIHTVLFPTLDVTRSYCDIVNFFIRSVWGGSRIIKNWQLNDTIGQYRGKILLASFDNVFDGCAVNLNNNCQIQSDHINNKDNKNIGIAKKSVLIHQLMKESFFKPFKCYINDISFFLAGHNRIDIAKNGGYYDQTRCSRPLNDIMTESFQVPLRALTIVLADFVTQELMDKVNDNNFSI